MALCARTESDEYAAALGNVLRQRVLENGREYGGIRQHDEGISRGVEICRLLGDQGLLHEGGLRRGTQRGAEVERRARIVSGMDEEHPLGIGAPHGEDTGVVFGESIAAIDAPLAAAEAVADIEGRKLHSGAAICGYADLARGDDLAVDKEGHGFLCCGRVEARNYGLDARQFGVFRIGELSRSLDTLNSPVGRRCS